MTRFLSHKIRFYSFACIALLLFVHGYNLNETYLVSFSLVDEPLTVTTFFEYFFANGILRFRIPLLFLISGYIFAMQDKRPYKERIKKRFYTLMIPYFLWSAIGIGITILFLQFPVTKEAVIAAQLDQMGSPTLYTEMSWHELFIRWTIAPISFQLWFIRSLFIYNLAYPAIKWLITKYPKMWFSFLTIGWMIGFSLIFIESMGLLFFSLGLWLRKAEINIEKPPKWFSYYLSWLFFIGLCVIRTFLAFETDNSDESFSHAPVFILLYMSSVVSGLLAIWFSADAIVKWFIQKQWFIWSSSFAFFVFGLHVPLLPYVTRIFYHYLSNVPNYRLITYIIAPCTVFFYCIAMGAIIRTYLPKVYNALTGGRGI